MNSGKDNYNKFKKYRKLILKWDNDLDAANSKWQPSFKKMMTQKDIFNHLVSQDKELENTYKLYQSILNCMKYKKGNLLNNLKYTDISSYMQTDIKALKKYNSHILNSIKYEYSKGVIEGINNKIKTIKRIAFGYDYFTISGIGYL